MDSAKRLVFFAGRHFQLTIPRLCLIIIIVKRMILEPIATHTEPFPKRCFTSNKEDETLGFDALAADSAACWEEKVWSRAPLEIDGPAWDLFVLRFAQYHMQLMTPAHDRRMYRPETMSARQP